MALGYGDYYSAALKRGYSSDKAHQYATALNGGSGLTKSYLDKTVNYLGSGTRTNPNQMYDSKTGQAITSYSGAVTPEEATKALGYTSPPQYNSPDVGSPQTITWDEAYQQAFNRLNPYYNTLRSSYEKQFLKQQEEAPQLQVAKYGGAYALRSGNFKSTMDILKQKQVKDINELENTRTSAIEGLTNDIYDNTNLSNYQKWNQQAQLKQKKAEDEYNAKLTAYNANMTRNAKPLTAWDLYMKKWKGFD